MNSNLPIWSDRFKDNHYKGLISELEQMIDECEDWEVLSKMASTLRNGLGGRALNKSRELRDDNGKTKEAAPRSPKKMEG